MMEKDFDKKLKDILNHPPEFEFSEKAWKNMEQLIRLNERSQGKDYSKWILLLLFSLLSLLFVTILSNRKLNDAQQKINQLQKQLTATSQLLQTDSQRIRTSITEYDTIYHRTTVYEKTYIKTPDSYSGKGQWLPYFKKPNFKFPQYIFNSSLSSYGRELFPLSRPLQNKAKEKKSTIVSFCHLLPPLNYLGLEEKPLSFPKIDHVDLSTHHPIERSFNPLLLLQPTGFRLGATAAIYIPFVNGAGGRFGYSSGVNGRIEFGKNFHLVLGAEFSALKYQINNELSLERYPEVSPQDPKDTFHELYANSKYLQIPFGFCYQTNTTKSLRPRLGIGLIARTPLQQVFKYEFLGNQVEYKLPQVFNTTRPLTINTFWGSLGLDYHFSDHWIGLLEGFYYQDFKQNSYEFEKLKSLGIKTGLQYKF